MPSPEEIGAFPLKKWRSEPQMLERVTRRTASSGSSTSASGTSTTRTLPISSKTTARTRSALVGEDRLDLTGQLHQDVRRVHVPDDRRQIAVDPQLALH